MGIASMLLWGANAEKDSSAKESLIIKVIRLALQRMEGENSNIKDSLTTFLTCMESSGIPVVKHNWRECVHPIGICMKLHLVGFIGRPQFTDSSQTLWQGPRLRQDAKT